MESTSDEFAKKLLNTVLRSKKVYDLKSSVPNSFRLVMSIKNREERLTSLIQLKKDIEKDIDEIVKLSDLNRHFNTNMTLAECLEIGVPPTEESKKRTQDLATIKKLKDLKTPIIQEIEKIRFQQSIRKITIRKSIEEQFIELFRDSSKAGRVIALLKSHSYINSDEKWIGRDGHKGELKEAYQALKNNDVLKEGKITTQSRVFYKRLKYDGDYDERTLRNNLKNTEIVIGFENLFASLFKKSS
jgi:hypothetical protein